MRKKTARKGVLEFYFFCFWKVKRRWKGSAYFGKIDSSKNRGDFCFWKIWNKHSFVFWRFWRISSLSKLDAPIPLIVIERHASVIKTNSQIKILLIGGLFCRNYFKFSFKAPLFWRNSNSNFCCFCFLRGLYCSRIF